MGWSNLAILYDPFYDRIIFANKIFFHRTMGDIPSVEFDLQVALYICAFKISLLQNFLRILLYDCIVFYRRRIEKRYNNINVSIAKILGLIVRKRGRFIFFFFFFSIPYISFERILILRDALSDSKPNDFYYFPTSYPLFSPLFFITLFFHDNPLRYKSRFHSSELEPIEVYRILKSIEEKCYSV